MPDDRELSDINPYDLMESEAARLEFYLASLTGEAWDEPSACEGWSVKDVLAHLAGGEEYNRACLTDSIGAMFERYTSRGATDLNAFNALGVSDRKDQRPADLLDEWRRENGETRSEMRHRDGEQMPTAVGQYPVRWQAWHLASELATHADDVNVPVTHKREEDARRDWRVRFARFALAESKPDVEVQIVTGGTWVRSDGDEATLSDDDFIDAVNARLPADHKLKPALREKLASLG